MYAELRVGLLVRRAAGSAGSAGWVPVSAMYVRRTAGQQVQSADFLRKPLLTAGSVPRIAGFNSNKWCLRGRSAGLRVCGVGQQNCGVCGVGPQNRGLGPQNCGVCGDCGVGPHACWYCGVCGVGPQGCGVCGVCGVGQLSCGVCGFCGVCRVVPRAGGSAGLVR